MTTVAHPEQEEQLLTRPLPFWHRINTSTLAMLIVTIAVCAIFTIANPLFVSITNLTNLATQVAPSLIVAVAVTFVITAGEIDLSVGSTLAFVGVMCALLLHAGVQSWVVLILGLVAGAAFGALNGWLSAYQRIPSFIVTLATMSVIRGIALIMTAGYAISVDQNLFFVKIGQAKTFGLSWAAWIAIIVAIIGAVVLHSTRFGQYIVGVGSNQESVRRAGVNTRFVKLIAFMFVGGMAGLAGMITTARLESANSNTAGDLGLTMVTAVVLGGTNLLGGRGSILGTVIGSVLVGSITDGLTLLAVSPYVAPILNGIILVIVILVNTRGTDLVGYLRRMVGRS